MSDSASQFVIGIDLGTTNSAVAYVDTSTGALTVRDFAIPQLVAPSTIESRATLPSFHYQAAAGEDLGGSNYAVGFFARDHGAASPGRLVTSAKSWLCHAGVDRTAGLLPWHGAADVEKLSPVQVTARYLGHIREAWDAAHPQQPMARQDVVLTVPASFDEVARELTAEAALKAGTANLMLLEEPQAAFYAWLHDHRDQWQTEVKPGQMILVCDIGGGTSDFTLIEARHADGGKVQFHRVAVGEHLILGGDNLDLALAHHVEKKISGQAKLEPRRWGTLLRLCRQAKETLLGRDAPEQLTISLPGAGSRLIGGATQVVVTREEVEQLLLDGFLPMVGLREKPAARRSGFQEFGLPYAADAAITKYLAAFLTAHLHAETVRPDIVLLNGGFFESPLLTRRLLDVLSRWFTSVGAKESWHPKLLPNTRLDLAVARGAAHYGLVRRGHAERISGGSAQTYYIGVETPDGQRSAICLLPAGLDDGQTADLSDREFKLLIRQPVEFPLYVSSVRTTDKSGQIIPVDALQMTELPPIRTVLHSGRAKTADAVSVTLHARRTEIGTLELWCAESWGDRKWRLQFDVRVATKPGREAHSGQAETQGFVERGIVDQCGALIRQAFRGQADDKPEGLIKRLETATSMLRADWPVSLMRSFWEVLMEVEPARRHSVEHETRWLNLAGYSLRPGFGLAVDDWRVAQTWRMQQSSPVRHDKNEQARAEWWVLWRRIAGGLTQGQQHALADPLMAMLRTYLRKVGTNKSSPIGWGPQEGAEVFRLLGSLELLKIPVKLELGEMLIAFVMREKSPFRDAATWAIGRLGSRVPLYGPLNAQPAAEDVEKWVLRLIELPQLPEKLLFALTQLARLTGDRYRDLTQATRAVALERMIASRAPEHYVRLVREGGELAAEEQKLAFGEALPRGLRIE